MMQNLFQSTLPVRGATFRRRKRDSMTTISIHAPRAGSDARLPAALPRRSRISIHAPRAGSDGLCPMATAGVRTISIHAPRAGSDAVVISSISTGDDFNPRSPCGERPDYRYCPSRVSAISIHAPRAGSDICVVSPVYHDINFNPRSPCGERRHNRRKSLGKLTNFNPRSPCGERQRLAYPSPRADKFQSTLPVRGAT